MNLDPRIGGPLGVGVDLPGSGGPGGRFFPNHRPGRGLSVNDCRALLAALSERGWDPCRPNASPKGDGLVGATQDETAVHPTRCPVVVSNPGNERERESGGQSGGVNQLKVSPFEFGGRRSDPGVRGPRTESPLAPATDGILNDVAIDSFFLLTGCLVGPDHSEAMIALTADVGLGGVYFSPIDP